MLIDLREGNARRAQWAGGQLCPRARVRSSLPVVVVSARMVERPESKLTLAALSAQNSSSVSGTTHSELKLVQAGGTVPSTCIATLSPQARTVPSELRAHTC